MADERPTIAADDGNLPALLSPTEWNQVSRVLKLSPQQSRIVELVLQDARDKQIAAALGLSLSTVRTYLTRIFTRLGVTDRVGLVIRVFSRHREERGCKACHRKR